MTGSRQNRFCSSRVALVLTLYTGMSGCAWGTATRVDVFLECPSPDRKILAVIWAQAGGGVAGWSQQLISLQASDEPLGRIAERQTGDGAPVLAVSSGERFELKWESRELLLITAAYSDAASVYSVRHSQEVRDRKIKVIYRELEAERQTFLPPKTLCESGSQHLENPAPKQLK
jgi:hypothetical protein